MSEHDAAINTHFEALVARCGGSHEALAVIGREIARLRDIEQSAREYVAAVQAQQDANCVIASPIAAQRRALAAHALQAALAGEGEALGL